MRRRRREKMGLKSLRLATMMRNVRTSATRNPLLVGKTPDEVPAKVAPGGNREMNRTELVIAKTR